MPDTPKFNIQMAGLWQDINDRMITYFESGEAARGLPLSEHGTQAVQLLEEFSLRRAKRIRGTLAALSYQMFGGQNRQTMMDIAVVMELIQSYLLIIDDVMDRSDMRRGGPTAHKRYESVLPETAEREHLANMLAINVGLIAQHQASKLLAGTPELPERVLRAQQILHNSITATVFGQIDDLYNDSVAVPGQAEDITAMYQLKSSYYTFICPLQTGAALAGASELDLEVYRKFGLHAGLGFQLQDDIVGMYGNPDESGKSAMDDLRDGKQTLLIHFALQNVDAAEAAIIRRALGNIQLTPEEHLEVQNILTASGARRHVVERSAKEINAALDILQAQKHWNQEGLEVLGNLLRQLTERKA